MKPEYAAKQRIVGPRSLRATFEDVLDAQEKLREWLDDLIRENRLIPIERRSQFMRLVANSLLGVGTKVRVGFTLADVRNFNRDSNDVPVDNVDYLLRFLAYADHQPEKHTMSYYWSKALNSLFEAFSQALHESAHISHELITRPETESHVF